MISMRAWSFSIGRLFGVEIRIHTFFLLLLGLAISYSSVSGSTGTRGFALWLILMLLPTGGLQQYATPEATEHAATPEIGKRLGIVGPIANLFFGLFLGAVILTVSPEINLLERPWLTPSHLIRGLVWINLLLAAVNLLPAAPLDGGRIFRGEFARNHGLLKGTRAAAGLGQIIGVLLAIAGCILPNMWLIMIGAFVFIGAHMDDSNIMLSSEHDPVVMRDVMLTDYSTLSASDTLEEALLRSVHTLQDVFPVVRGSNLVGAVSRQGIVEALQAEGNGYVQGVMTKSFQVAQPDDSLVKTLRRIMAGKGAQLVPIMDGNRIVGIITPQNLAHSIGLLSARRRLLQQEEPQD